MDYKTPNVYVEEVSTLPPSVAGVATAIPAFIGYTEKAGNNGNNLTNIPTKISSFKEYEDMFGTAAAANFTVNVEKGKDDAGKTIYNIKEIKTPEITHLMYYSLRMFFNNGGESCYIVSVSKKNQSAKENFKAALDALRKEDEPTLIVFPDATKFASSEAYYQLCIDALDQCADLKDRFTIMDVVGDITDFRTGISSDYLKYGAAYCPDIQTSLNFHYTDASVTVSGSGATDSSKDKTYIYEDNGIKVSWSGINTTPKIKLEAKSANTTVFDFESTDNILSIKFPGKSASKTTEKLIDDWNAKKPLDCTFDIVQIDGSSDLSDFLSDGKSISLNEADGSSSGATSLNGNLAEIALRNTDLYNRIKIALAKKRVLLPPSPAIAGVYARVDRDRGVWKAPANVALSSVLAPVDKITDKDQENMNVDPESGKSINCIRSFAGKGTLVWGARTLAGNDNEWRYVPVRRLFNYIEESIQKATAFAVFEPNTAMTWLKVRTMIESFLDSLWRQGAFAGATQEQAFFVHAGLGSTMIEQDILEGRMIIEIGVAAVRPAEFIILRFSHKLQEA